jgi:superfamily I DNA and RNA helicase
LKQLHLFKKATQKAGGIKMSFKHKGIAIMFREEHGDFQARVGDNEVLGESIKEVKKGIDEALKTKIKRGVKVFVMPYYNESGIAEAEITSLAMDDYYASVWVKYKDEVRRKVSINYLLRHDTEAIEKLEKMRAEYERLGEEIKAFKDALALTKGELMKMLGIEEKGEGNARD